MDDKFRELLNRYLNFKGDKPSPPSFPSPTEFDEIEDEYADEGEMYFVVGMGDNGG